MNFGVQIKKTKKFQTKRIMQIIFFFYKALVDRRTLCVMTAGVIMSVRYVYSLSPCKNSDRTYACLKTLLSDAAALNSTHSQAER